jgi:hypothetical protein
VFLHGALRDTAAARDLLVREAGRDGGHDLALTEGQRVRAAQLRAQPATGAPPDDQPTQQRGRPIHERTERPRLERVGIARA